MNKPLHGIKEKIKHYIYWDYWFFLGINTVYSLRLDYRSNKGGIHILRDIFINKTYGFLFPKGEMATIMDIGAHYGYFTLFAAHVSSNKHRIYAVEPSPENVKILKRNLHSAGISNQVTIINKAIARKSGKGNLYMGRPQNHSLYKDYIPDLHEGISVETISLDDCIREEKINQIDFLKLDCEGSEYEIIMNTSEANLQIIKTIHMEVHDMRHCGYSYYSLVAFLEKNGFTICHGHKNENLLIRGFNTKLVVSRIR